MELSGASEDEIRDRAVESLKQKRAFRTQVLTWVGVSILLIVIWALTGADFFRPVFPIAGWGIGIAVQAWSIYGPGSKPITESDIARESERLRQ
ncbi:MAG: 2TM domain-containing protein [Solirubrobacterales bacterium]